jgi:hypothetical protein
MVICLGCVEGEFGVNRVCLKARLSHSTDRNFQAGPEQALVVQHGILEEALESE